MHSVFRRLASVALFLFAPTSLLAQVTAEQVLKNMHDGYRARMQVVDDFTVVSKMEGGVGAVDSITTYYKKEVIDGRPVFQTRVKVSGSWGDAMDDAIGGPQQADMLGMMDKMYTYFAQSARYEGTETINGHPTHVLFIEDLSPLVQDLSGTSDPDQVKAKSGKLYVDAEAWVPRKMSMEMDMDMGGGPRTVTSTTVMDDYREAGPILYPYHVTTTIENLLSDEQRAAAQKQMEAARARLAQLPEAQRAQMEKMLESSASLLASQQMEMGMTVQDLKVNTGVPEALFKD